VRADGADRRAALRAVDTRFAEFKAQLAGLVRVPGVSAPGFPAGELRRSAARTADALQRLGVAEVEVLEVPGAPPYVVGECAGALGGPTVLVYGHHDVAPPGPTEAWTTHPFRPVERRGRLHGRGSADDKGAFLAWAAGAAAYLGSSGRVPVHVRFLIEGGEEVGSPRLAEVLRGQRSRLCPDVLVVPDGTTPATGVPAITWQLRGAVDVDVEVSCLDRPVHSGDFGGAVPDPVRILCGLLEDLHGPDGRIAVPGLYGKVARPSAAVRRRLRERPFSEAAFRRAAGMLRGTRLERERGASVWEQAFARPGLAIVGIDVHPLQGAANQILDSARARVSLRTVPDMDPGEAGALLVRKLSARPPAGARVTARIVRSAPWWRAEPAGPAFDAAWRALEQGFGRKPVLLGGGGYLGALGPLAAAYPKTPLLLTGILDPGSGAHAPDEGLHLADWRRLIRSAVHFYAELATLERTRR
jgi:acetylornithine deacetylase/succinyl-diaminopimelate desuccinylase-like protein